MKIAKNILLPILLVVAFFSVLPRCAKVVSPTGGPKDTLAPVMIRSLPQFATTNFKGEKVVISFNEYIQLKDIAQKLVVSPPMVKKPEIRLKGKSVEILFKEPLIANSTYTIYFSDAIQDNNENNPIKNFEFVFATGNIIDTLALAGSVSDAFTLKPVEGVFVMLYEKQLDSVPYKELPMHIARTNKQGKFRLSNLKNTDYKLFALKDGNSNYKFDQSTEEIAFSKEIIKKSTLSNPSSLKDTIKNQIKLSLFKEENPIQVLTGYTRDLENKITLVFSRKPTGKISLTPLGFEKTKNWFIKETNLTGDSLTFWITDEKIEAKDTLRIITSYQKTDSLFRLKQFVDTLKYIYTEPEKVKTRKKDVDKQPKPESLGFSCSVKEGKITKPNNPVLFKFAQPLKSLDQSKILLYNFTDSTQIENLPILKDSINPRIYRFSYEWGSANAYRLIFLPGAFSSIDNKTNDSLMVNFKGANPEDFGTLSISLQNTKKTIIVELLSESGSLIDKIIATEGTKPIFKYVDPGKYRMRFIEDDNKNGKWDTGNYLKKRQPEKVYVFSDPKSKGVINVRANWENEISFDFSKK